MWSRSDWALLFKITLHTDSVWDIKIRPNLDMNLADEAIAEEPKITYTFATAGLDGAVGVFHIFTDKCDTLGLRMAFLLQVCELIRYRNYIPISIKK